ncbi:ABC transporter ATP-binding protein [Bacillaceae bacterium]
MTGTENAVLQVRNLTKKIGGKTIVENLTFDVFAGEVFGFLGPNGAGKTTTIRMLVGLIKPTRGSVFIAGRELKKDFRAAMRNVGCIVENPELYSFLTGWQNLRQFARMLGDVEDERIDEVARLVGLHGRIHDKVKTYSLGMRQRLGIAQALLGKPKLLILDEPTNGLDPAGIREMREFVRSLAKKEALAIFVSSHLLSEIQLMCDRVAIINKGKLVKVAKIEDLLQKAMDKVEWIVDPPELAEQLLAGFGFVSDLSRETDRLVCRMPMEKVSEVNALLVANGVRVGGISRQTVTLEDLFVQMTSLEPGREGRRESAGKGGVRDA